MVLINFFCQICIVLYIYKCRKLLTSVEFLLVSPSLIRDSESEQTWHISSSMHYACSCVMGCMEAQQSEGCAVRSFLWSCWFVPVWWGTYMLCASVVGNLCFVPVWWGTYALCQCTGEPTLCPSVVGNLYMLCASVVGNLYALCQCGGEPICFVPVW